MKSLKIAINGTVVRSVSPELNIVTGLIFEEENSHGVWEGRVSEVKDMIIDALDFISDMKSDKDEFYPEVVDDYIINIADELQILEELMNEYEDEAIVSCEKPSDIPDDFLKNSWKKLENLLKGLYNDKIISPEISEAFQMFKITMNKSYGDLFTISDDFQLLKISKLSLIKTNLTLILSEDKETIVGKIGEVFKHFEADFYQEGDSIVLLISDKELLRIAKKDLWVKVLLFNKKKGFSHIYLYNSPESIARYLKQKKEVYERISVSDFNKVEVLLFDSVSETFQIEDKRFNKVKEIYPYLKEEDKVNPSDIIEE